MVVQSWDDGCNGGQRVLVEVGTGVLYLLCLGSMFLCPMVSVGRGFALTSVPFSRCSPPPTTWQPLARSVAAADAHQPVDERAGVPPTEK